jgi:hypothetical protein
MQIYCFEQEFCSSGAWGFGKSIFIFKTLMDASKFKTYASYNIINNGTSTSKTWSVYETRCFKCEIIYVFSWGCSWHGTPLKHGLYHVSFLPLIHISSQYPKHVSIAHPNIWFLFLKHVLFSFGRGSSCKHVIWPSKHGSWNLKLSAF